MKDVISAKTAGFVMLVLLAALFVFHVLVLVGIIPPIVWGGQATDHASVIIGELVSLFMTVLFMIIVAMRAEFLLPGRFRRIAAIGIWCIAVVFLLSTIGNISSTITAEKLIFTPISVVLVIFAVRLGIERHQ